MQPATTPRCSLNGTHPRRRKYEHATSTRNARTARFDAAHVQATSSPDLKGFSCSIEEKKLKEKDLFFQTFKKTYTKKGSYRFIINSKYKKGILFPVAPALSTLIAC
jgi:hypothetical protein